MKVLLYLLFIERKCDDSASQLSKMKYLVTGAAGFIGSAIVDKLIREGNNECTTIDNLFTGIKDNIPRGCRFIEGNVADSNIIDQIRNESYDAIIHIAGQSFGEVSFENPIYDFETNAKSTLLLLELAKKNGIKKFVFASSMSVYGEPERELVDENSLTLPKSFYAVGKLASENYMRIFSEFGIQCTSLRFFNVYGIGQNMDNLKQGMFSIYLAQAINNHHIIVKGSKDRFRDFIYIDDVVRAVLLAIDRPFKSEFETFNVCSGKKRTVEELLDVIKEKLPFNITENYIEGTPGDQHGIYGDYSKINKMLGWKPQVGFDEGTSLMIDWALKK